MPTRTARTAWNGTLQEGSGQVELTSSGVGTYEVSFPKRAADESPGTTSPEELIAAAHAACYAMSLSNEIAQAGGTPQALDVTADVTLGADPNGRLRDHRHQAHRRGRGRRARRGGVRGGRAEGEGRLPGQQGAHRHDDHPRSLARLVLQNGASSRPPCDRGVERGSAGARARSRCSPVPASAPTPASPTSAGPNGVWTRDPKAERLATLDTYLERPRGPARVVGEAARA